MDIVERIESRLNDSHMDVEHMLDDAASEITRLREENKVMRELHERIRDDPDTQISLFIWQEVTEALGDSRSASHFWNEVEGDPALCLKDGKFSWKPLSLATTGCE